MVKGKFVFTYIINCVDGDFHLHHVAMTYKSKAHDFLEDFIKNGVTVHDGTDETWTRISPHHISAITMSEVK